MENNYALVGILAIVLISIVAVSYDASITGNAYLGYYGRSKVYGGDLKKQFQRPANLGKAYSEALFIQRNQQYMLANKDKWQCKFDTADGPYPCMYDDGMKKWCCIIPEQTQTLSAPSSSESRKAQFRGLSGLTASK